MEIIVKPLPLKKWHKNTDDKSFTRAKPVKALVDSYTMEYATGLDENDIEKLKGKGVSYDLSSNFHPDKAHPFWDAKIGKVYLPNSTKIFNTDRTLDFIYYKMMLKSKYVANSLAEWEEGKFPEAHHYIHNDEKQISAKATKIELKKKALILADKLSKKEKINLLLVISDKNVKDLSNDYIEVELDKLISKKARAVIDFIKGDKEYNSTLALVKECLQKNILTKKKHKISYLDSVLGTTPGEVTDYLNEVDNQDLKMRLIDAVK